MARWRFPTRSIYCTCPWAAAVVNLATRISDLPVFELVVVALAFAFAIAAAAMLHAFVERPSRELAARIAYEVIRARQHAAERATT